MSENKNLDRTTERLPANVTGLARAATILRAGGTVAFPTETVYGLGANALDAEAVQKIFSAKQRPAWDPLIVHVAARDMVANLVNLEGEVATQAELLMDAFWPGPLTLLLPRSSVIPDAVTAGRALVGLRMPAHQVARELIRLAGVPIAAPSANRFGGTSPTSAAHVLADLDGRIDAVLEGDASTVGLESTVYDVAARTIYRPGAVTAERIAQVLGLHAPVPIVASSSPESAAATLAGLASPGMGMRHYAPRAPLLLVENQQDMLAEIARHPGSDVGVMLPDDWRYGDAAVQFRWGPWNDAPTLARLLYFGLRMLDSRGVKVIVCPVPQMDGLGEALRDRLSKAARSE